MNTPNADYDPWVICVLDTKVWARLCTEPESAKQGDRKVFVFLVYHISIYQVVAATRANVVVKIAKAGTGRP